MASIVDKGTDHRVLPLRQHSTGVAIMGQVLLLLTSSSSTITTLETSSSSLTTMELGATEGVLLGHTTSSSSSTVTTRSSSSPTMALAMLPLLMVCVVGLELRQGRGGRQAQQLAMVVVMVMQGLQEGLLLGAGLVQLGQVAGMMRSSWRSSCRTR